MAAIIIQDACLLINLLSSGRFEEMAGGCGLRFAITRAAAREALFLHDPVSGERERIELQPLIEEGLLELLAAESENEKERYLELALSLDDGEAESVAIAETRNLALATDDKKARNLIRREGLKIELWSPCSLLRHWQGKCAVPDPETKCVLANTSNRAKYRPKCGQPDFEWWKKLSSQ
jgi:hypothetical protein